LTNVVLYFKVVWDFKKYMAIIIYRGSHFMGFGARLIPGLVVVRKNQGFQPITKLACAFQSRGGGRAGKKKNVPVIRLRKVFRSVVSICSQSCLGLYVYSWGYS
jgi:hypothetical protein